MRNSSRLLNILWLGFWAAGWSCPAGSMAQAGRNGPAENPAPAVERGVRPGPASRDVRGAENDVFGSDPGRISLDRLRGIIESSPSFRERYIAANILLLHARALFDLGATGDQGSAAAIARLIAGPSGWPRQFAWPLNIVSPRSVVIVKRIFDPAGSGTGNSPGVIQIGRAAASALADRDWRIRLAACEALLLVDGEDIPAGLCRLVTDPEWPVRRAAIRALGSLANPAAVPVIAAALKDADRFDRVEMAWALGRIGRESAVAVLAECLENDPSQRVREEAVYSLTRISELKLAGEDDQALWIIELLVRAKSRGENRVISGKIQECVRLLQDRSNGGSGGFPGE